jgi:hypothetical protein
VVLRDDDQQNGGRENLGRASRQARYIRYCNGGIMLRITLWKAKLKAAKAELKIREKDYNASGRIYVKTIKTINQLEEKINAYMAKTKRAAKDFG